MDRFIRVYRTVLIAVSSLLLVLLTLNVGLQVLSRYFAVKVPTWTVEMGSYLLIWIIAAANGILFLDKAPISIDALLHNVSEKIRRFILILHTVIACFFSTALVISSLKLIKLGSRMRTPIMRLQYSYIYSSLTVMGVLIITSVLLRFAVEQRKAKSNGREC